MKKGQIMEGVVERVDFPDKGIIHTEDGSVTVKNTIPGQCVRFMISKKRSGRAEGRLLEVLRPSELETREPECGIFPACGGCSWQTVGYTDQLAMKAEQVKRLLAPVTKSDRIDTIFEGIHGSPKEFEYRNKMEFSFGDEYKDGPLCLGLHRRGSHYDVLTASGCRLVHSDMTRILTATLAFFSERQIPYYHKMAHEGILRHLLLRRAEKTGDILVCLVTASAPENVPVSESASIVESASTPESISVPKSASWQENSSVSESAVGFGEILQQYTSLIRSLPIDGHIAGILHMRNDSLADIVQSDETTVLYGQDYFYEELLGLRFKVTPFSFFQTNSPGAEVLYATARDYIGDTKSATLFDLYSGTGTIAQILAPIAGKVIGVEIVEEAVAAARENARINGLENCTFLAGDVLKVLDTIPDRPDFIVLDPPREGIHPKALQKIIAYGAPHILYISCKPTSLARDLEVLLASGYQAEQICCVDMFPQTTSVETVCLLGNHRLPKPDATVKIGIDMEDYYRIRDNAENKEKPE
ncbi:MAG: 23S rRNA (uracil(1939)-C(5))-methyltransferase RlmD [Lachnospiraceae bacterium]|nr:23S rRNA (uracil(1939)-C(5))-methyltransferase RlmD [Lachnospiraceae bacterium]